MLYGEQIVMPVSFQKQVLNDFQMGYPEILRMRPLRLSYVCNTVITSYST